MCTSYKITSLIFFTDIIFRLTFLQLLICTSLDLQDSFVVINSEENKTLKNILKKKNSRVPSNPHGSSLSRLSSTSSQREAENGGLWRGTGPEKPSAAKALPLTVGTGQTTQPYRAPVSSSLKWGRSRLPHGNLMRTHLPGA